MRATIADYELTQAWEGAGHRHVARPPARTGLDEPVLITTLAIDAEGWQSLSDRLARLARLPGDGLLKVVELGPDLETGSVFLVTELAEPLHLPVAPTDAVSIVARAARTLHTMHEAGLAYGPFTASALLSARGGSVIDLPRLDSRPGEIFDQVDWRALEATDPESLGGESPTRGSDIWSLGAVLHSLLSERPLYPGMADDETVTAVQRVLFTRPGPDLRIPEAERSVIQDCLEPDPADRPPSALIVAERLEAAATRP